MGLSTRVLLITALTTVLVAALSYALPDRYAATGVGLAFLAATYLLVLRGDEALVSHHGLSLGGLLDARSLKLGRLIGDGAVALGWAVAVAAVIFPLFWVGYRWWWQPSAPFSWVPPSSMFDDVLGQVLVVALPEEAFYRGFVQTSLDDAWKPRRKFLGAELGWGILVTSTLFAAGHFLTEPRPYRLAVFFPSLVFGWLRARTGGIGASIAFHAMSNLFSAMLARGFGLVH